MNHLIITMLLWHVINVVAHTPTQPKDKQPGSSGSDVVQAVINDLKNACIFSDDKLFLRRLAYVESKDGVSDKTYRQTYNGGIWQVDELRFRMTHMPGPPLQKLRQNILHKLGIDWSKVSWSDLRKPLFSGLAAALYVVVMTKGHPEVIPESIDDQAHYWVATYRATNSSQDFVTSAQAMQQGCKTDDKIDLLFILESSSKISTTNFEKVKNFTKRIVNSLNISSNNVRIAVERYSTAATVSFLLDAHPNNLSVLAAIDNVSYVAGGMNLADALHLATDQVFGQNYNRTDAAKVIVLVTSEKPDDQIEVMKHAFVAKKQKITIYTVAVGPNVDVMAFQPVASLPPCSHTFNLKSYNELEKLTLSLVQAQCTVPTTLQSGEYTYPCGFDVILQTFGGSLGSTMTISLTQGKAEAYGSYTIAYPGISHNDISKNVTSATPATFPVPAQKNISVSLLTKTVQGLTCSGNFKVVVETTRSNKTDCRNKKADVIILLDAGETKTAGEFNKMLDFSSKFVSQFDIGSDKTHFGLVDFAENATNQFWLTDHTTKGEILNAFHNPQRYGKAADLSSALAFVREYSFSPRHGVRKDADKVIVLVTESTSGQSAAIQREAKLLHNEGVRIIVITIGNNFDQGTLATMASWGHHVEHISAFDDLDGVVLNVTEVACAKVKLVCEELGLKKNCSIEDLVKLIGPQFGAALVPGHGYLASNPCNMSRAFPGMPQISRFPHPTDTDKFIMCENHESLIVLCPPNEIYDGVKEICVVAPATTTTAPPTTHRGISSQSAAGSSQQPPSGNVIICTPININKNLLNHPYPQDPHKYIHCAGIPYTGRILSCPPNKIFLDSVHKCGNEFVVLENGQFDKTKPNPCTTPGDTFQQSNTSKYVYCDKDGNALMKTCPPPKIFNNFLHACDF